MFLTQQFYIKINTFLFIDEKHTCTIEWVVLYVYVYVYETIRVQDRMEIFYEKTMVPDRTLVIYCTLDELSMIRIFYSNNV